MVNRKLSAQVGVYTKRLQFLEDLSFIVPTEGTDLNAIARRLGVERDSLVRRMVRLRLVDDLLTMVPTEKTGLVYVVRSGIDWDALLDTHERARNAAQDQLDRSKLPPWPPLSQPRLLIPDHEDLPRYTPAQ
jgi:hypothetical protein